MKKYKFEMIATECLQIEVEADDYKKAEEIASQSCFEEDWETTDWSGGEIICIKMPENLEEEKPTYVEEWTTSIAIKDKYESIKGDNADYFVQEDE